MSRLIKTVAVAALAATAGCAAGYAATGISLLLTLAITAGTVAYHFLMRLAVGGLFQWKMHNRADYRKPWYQLRPWEEALYQKLCVQRWKKYMPTYDAAQFDVKRHSWEEIVQAMCQAELVHETIVPLSFLPVAASVWLGALPVFLITSVFAALFDGLFVVMQRYNRARVVRHLDKTRRKQHLLDN